MEIMYDPIEDEVILKEPGWIGSVHGYRYIQCVDFEKDLARLLIARAVIDRLVLIGEL